jgi:tRNA (guanine10-N2)-dimethyltransferase
MKYLCCLSQDHPRLALAELQSVSGCDVSGVRYIIVEEEFSYERLAYTQSVYELLFSCCFADLPDTIQAFEWEGQYEKSYKVECVGLDVAMVADAIWRAQRSPTVDVRAPSERFYFFRDDLVYCGRLLWKRPSFEARKAHQLPTLHPVALHPKLARAMVNLVNAPIGSLILDPFCGTGGILIEAALIGYRAKGYEILATVCKKARANIAEYGPNISVNEGDALTFDLSDYIVTDLPYGKNTVSIDMLKLYSSFFHHAISQNVKKMVIGVSSDVDIIAVCETYRVINSFDYYIHRSLSKKIIVLSR